MEDRRIFERINARFPLRFVDANKGREGSAETVDISANGIGLVTSEAVSAHTPLELWLEIPDQHNPLYTRGEIVWSNPVAGSANLQRAGICLERPELMGLARVLWLERSA